MKRQAVGLKAVDEVAGLGAGLSDFVNAEEAASDFFAGEERRALSGEKAMDALRARFGRDAVVSGRALRRKS
jgi:DNA polymerase-4